jgi:WD40 repeat protein
VSGTDDGLVQRWALASGNPLGSPIHKQGSVFVDDSRVGNTIVFGDSAGSVEVWNGSGRPRTVAANLGKIYTVAASRDGSQVAVAGNIPAITILNTQTRAGPRKLIGHTDSVASVAFSHKDDLLASGGGDDTLRLWSVATGTLSRAPLTGPTGYVRAVAFSPDDRTVAAASADATIRLWDVKSGSELGKPLGVNTKSIEALAFSPDGSFLISGGGDGEVRTWPGVPLSDSFAVLKAQVCGLVGGGLQAPERKEYAPGLPLGDPCR